MNYKLGIVLASGLLAVAIIVWVMIGEGPATGSAPRTPLESQIAHPEVGESSPVAGGPPAAAPAWSGAPRAPIAAAPGSSSPAVATRGPAPATTRPDGIAPMAPAPRPDSPEPPLSPAANAEDTTATLLDLDKVSLMLRDYRTRMGENPFGTNAEIMQAVMGGNRAKAMIGPPEGQGLNGKGELVDRWGTPYFFHQMSATHMEIHSAGPDKMRGTNDDIILR